METALLAYYSSFQNVIIGSNEKTPTFSLKELKTEFYEKSFCQYLFGLISFPFLITWGTKKEINYSDHEVMFKLINDEETRRISQFKQNPSDENKAALTIYTSLASIAQSFLSNN